MNKILTKTLRHSKSIDASPHSPRHISNSMVDIIYETNSQFSQINLNFYFSDIAQELSNVTQDQRQGTTRQDSNSKK